MNIYANVVAQDMSDSADRLEETIVDLRAAAALAETGEEYLARRRALSSLIDVRLVATELSDTINATAT